MFLLDSHYIPYYHCHYCRNGIFKLSSEINKRSTFSAVFIKSIELFTRNFSGVRVIKAYSLEEQHQNNMENLAYESKIKV
jgi:ATP-binding cassette subfamily B protein